MRRMPLLQAVDHHSGSGWSKAAASGPIQSFVNSATSRCGRNFWLQQLGPTAGTVDEAAKLASAQNKMPALSRMIESNTPGSTLWYRRAPFDRVSDQLLLHADPDSCKSFERIEKLAPKHGTDFSWAARKQAPHAAHGEWEGERVFASASSQSASASAKSMRSIANRNEAGKLTTIEHPEHASTIGRLVRRSIFRGRGASSLQACLPHMRSPTARYIQWQKTRSASRGLHSGQCSLSTCGDRRTYARVERKPESPSRSEPVRRLVLEALSHET